MLQPGNRQKSIPGGRRDFKERFPPRSAARRASKLLPREGFRGRGERWNKDLLDALFTPPLWRASGSSLCQHSCSSATCSLALEAAAGLPVGRMMGVGASITTGIRGPSPTRQARRALRARKCLFRAREGPFGPEGTSYLRSRKHDFVQPWGANQHVYVVRPCMWDQGPVFRW